MIRLAASLADGIPAELCDGFTVMDTSNVDRAVGAMVYALGTPTRKTLNARHTRDFADMAVWRSMATSIC